MLLVQMLLKNMLKKQKKIISDAQKKEKKDIELAENKTVRLVHFQKS